MSNELTVVEQNELTTHEATIQQGLDAFLAVGKALHEIKTQKLYRGTHSSFDSYCNDKWDIKVGKGNYLAKIGGIAADLEGLEVPTKPYHVQQLEILDDPNLRAKAWQNAVNNAGAQLKGKDVLWAAREQKVRNCGVMRLMDDFTNGQIALGEAWDIWVNFYDKPTYAPKFVDAYEIYGGSLSTFKALKQFSYNWADEANSILATGWLDTGTLQLPLKDVTTTHIEAFGRYLQREVIETRKLEAAIKQKQTLVNSRTQVLSGFEILENQLAGQLTYLYPEGAVALEQLAKKLAKEGKQVLLVVAYDEHNEPDLNFDLQRGSTIKASALNGVKPHPLVKMMQTL